MAERRRSSGASGGNPGCILWLAAFVVVLLLFVLNWGKIKGTLERTNFNEIVRTQRGLDPAKPREVAPVAPAPKVDPDPAFKAPGPGAKAPASALTDVPANPQPAAAPKAGAEQASQGQLSGQGAAPAKPEAVPVKFRPASLFFVRIDDDGIIVRQEVRRNIPSSDSPLTDALAALLKGPTEDELRKKLISLLPQGTKLLAVQVRGSTAFLNFNEAFMYNHYGIEGYAGQLKQVVYTATSFPSVQDVQILIEGDRHDYLGGEGVYIGKPLSRNSF